MADDIVELLRAEADDIVENWDLMAQAADEIERLRAELSTFVRWGQWLTVEGLCNHSSDEPCTRTDHVQHPMFVRWEARRG